VFLTAYDTADIVQKAINTSPQSYITKPFKNVDLITAVELAIRQFANLEKRKPSVLVKDGVQY
jgi:AmiR/NasT family two-component response regulator